MRTAQGWREEFEGHDEYERYSIREILADMEALEHQVAVYKEDRLVLVGRIHELEEQVNEYKD